jgi:hypothetical protein
VDWTGILLIAVAVAAAVVVAVWFGASRLDRLHRRIDRAQAALELQLTRRASVCLVLARTGLWDQSESAVVERAARAALTAAPPGQEHSELSAVVREALAGRRRLESAREDPAVAGLLDDLAGVWFRASLARRFLNEAVGLTGRLRSRRLVRFFHLAGRAPLPLTCDIDDAPPESWPDGRPGPPPPPPEANPPSPAACPEPPAEF